MPPTPPAKPSSEAITWPVVAAVVVGLSGGLILSIPLSRLIMEPSRTADQSFVLPQPVPPANPFVGWTGFGAREVVVLGRDRTGNNTDVIFTVRVDGTTTSITQIPRDSYIDAEGFGGIKLNALMAYGGVEAVERELSRLMNRPIRYHIVVRLDALETLANLVGGIEVDVPKRLYYVDRSQDLVIDLQPGPQLLKGKDLEGFLRWRNDGRGDFGRLERQQLALKGLFEQMKQPQNLIRLPALITAAGQALETDLGPMELGGLITAMGTTELKASSLKSVPFNADGISYLDTEWPAKSSSDSEGSQRFRFLF
ncbi:LytR family transcriptional regulator [Synechococcus sp. MU1643]|uniref:LCP family protein n=1 Tax=Synechococcus sp. MU1643 TaxID=2508349 RepID=UPI001CF87286|nr:LCP family protein [Synechococcus sp. MU1643]MCB4427476.1 LytR family transcriptional regulator [Synechococcus sp. MU1643]